MWQEMKRPACINKFIYTHPRTGNQYLLSQNHICPYPNRVQITNAILSHQVFQDRTPQCSGYNVLSILEIKTVQSLGAESLSPVTTYENNWVTAWMCEQVFIVHLWCNVHVACKCFYEDRVPANNS